MRLLSLIVACAITAATPGFANDEIYIADIGAGLLVLRQEDRGLTVPESVLFVKDFWSSPRVVAERRDDVLTVTVETSWGGGGGSSPRSNPFSVCSLVRSKSVPGDYDLLAISGLVNDKGVSVLQEPCRSYLHRVDDPRIVRYHSLRSEAAQGSVPAELAALGGQIAAARPDDLQARLLYWDSLNCSGNAGALAADMEAYRPRFAAADRPLQVRYRQMAAELVSLQSSLAGRNSWDIACAFQDRQLDLDSLMRRAPEFILKPDFIPRRGKLVWGGPNYLTGQVLTKVVRTQATLLLFRGEYHASRDALLGTYRFGQMMSVQESETMSLVGTAVRVISTVGLDLYVQNACHSPAELQQVMGWLDWTVANRPRSWGTSETLLLLKDVRTYSDPPAMNKTVRESCADARFELLRATVATRHVLLSDLVYPRSGNFGPLLPQGLPKDPFADAPLRCARHAGDSAFMLYSVGPDRVDNNTLVQYDPTNGIVSGGDICCEVPRQPKYPFPRGRVRAGTEGQVRQQFPGGLPPDIFADTRGKELSICPVSPLRIYSVGPDAQPSSFPGGGSGQNSVLYVPSVLYDPTNGLFSPGDMFVDLSLR